MCFHSRTRIFSLSSNRNWRDCSITDWVNIAPQNSRQASLIWVAYSLFVKLSISANEGQCCFFLHTEEKWRFPKYPLKNLDLPGSSLKLRLMTTPVSKLGSSGLWKIPTKTDAQILLRNRETAPLRLFELRFRLPPGPRRPRGPNRLDLQDFQGLFRAGTVPERQVSLEPQDDLRIRSARCRKTRRLARGPGQRAGTLTKQ